MAIPDYQSLMLPLLSEAATGGEMRVADVTDSLADKLGLNDEDRSQLLPSGRQKVFYNRTQWAKFYLDKAGLIEPTRRGYFKITERGRNILASNPLRIDNETLRQFPEFVEFEKGGNASQATEATPPIAVEDEAKTPDEVMRAAHRQIEASLAHELLERIRAAPPDFFERLIISLLLGMGFGGTVEDAGRALGRSGDGGIDGVVDQDAFGLDRVYVQAKRYAVGNNIGSGAIRDFFGSLDRHKASKGLFVTTSSFSPSATETANFLSKRIVLVDGEQLAKLMIRYNVGCRVEDTLHIRRIDEDFFE
jgi:restriction system protein